MEGKVTSVYYKDLTQEEKDFVDTIERSEMLNKREKFKRDPMYSNFDPEDIWYLKLEYINNWKHNDNYIFTRCECGSLEFSCLMDDMAPNGMDRECLYKCCKCGKTHWEYN